MKRNRYLENARSIFRTIRLVSYTGETTSYEVPDVVSAYLAVHPDVHVDVQLLLRSEYDRFVYRSRSPGFNQYIRRRIWLAKARW